MLRGGYAGLLSLIGLPAAASLPGAGAAHPGGPSGIDLPNRFAPAASFGQFTAGCTSDLGCPQGIRTGNAADGMVTHFIPRPDGDPVGAATVTADVNGTTYRASNAGKQIVRFSNKS